MTASPTRHVMPADQRARDVHAREVLARRHLRVHTPLDDPTARVRRVARRIFAVWSFGWAVAFAWAALLLAKSADPVVAVVPTGIAIVLGLCASELWPRARVSRSAGGSRAVVCRGVRTTEGSARRIDV